MTTSFQILICRVLKDPVSHNSFKEMYIPGHMRATSYFVGILVGYIKFYMNENNTKISEKVVKIGKKSRNSWLKNFKTKVCSLDTLCSHNGGLLIHRTFVLFIWSSSIIYRFICLTISFCLEYLCSLDGYCYLIRIWT